MTWPISTRSLCTEGLVRRIEIITFFAILTNFGFVVPIAQAKSDCATSKEALVKIVNAKYEVADALQEAEAALGSIPPPDQATNEENQRRKDLDATITNKTSRMEELRNTERTWNSRVVAQCGN